MSSVAYGILWVLARTVAWLCFRFRVEGSVPKQGGVLVAANHASYFDIPLLGCGMFRRAWYLGRSDLFMFDIYSGTRHAAFGRSMRADLKQATPNDPSACRTQPAPGLAAH